MIRIQLTTNIFSDHNFERGVLVEGYEGQAEFQRQLKYFATNANGDVFPMSLREIACLIDYSERCEQTISWGCVVSRYETITCIENSDSCNIYQFLGDFCINFLSFEIIFMKCKHTIRYTRDLDMLRCCRMPNSICL